MLAPIGAFFFSSELHKAIAEANRSKQHFNRYLTVSDIELLAEALIVAEDRRFWCHRGVDCRALIRAVIVFLRGKPIQGASTITQQFVRVAIADYRMSIGRKLKEICISCALDREIPKQDQASAYLLIAYFGWRMRGCEQAVRRLRFSSPISVSNAAEVVARLRYPEPQHVSHEIQRKIIRRAKNIEVQLLSEQ